MQLGKNKINILLMNWVRWDTVLQKALRGIQIKILIERIIEEKSFKTLGETYKASPQKVRCIFLAMILKIEKTHGLAMASLLREINTKLEAIEAGIDPKDTGFELGKVFLN